MYLPQHFLCFATGSCAQFGIAQYLLPWYLQQSFMGCDSADQPCNPRNCFDLVP